MREKSPIAAGLLALAALAQPAVAQNAMTVVRDAETGELRAPTPAEASALQSTVRARSAAPQARPQSVLRADGTRALDLGERGMVYSVATRAADGKLTKKCVKGAHAGDAMQHQDGSDHDHK